MGFAQNDSDKCMLPSTITQNRILTLGHSPDPDDAFLFYGMTSGRINLEGLQFEHVLQDIEMLNQRSFQGEMDVTAVSVHTYAYISHQYALLPYGASVGEKYGPILVAKKPIALDRLPYVKIASPGPRTTAQMVLSLCLKPTQVVFVPFDQILGQVIFGKVGAGLLIHEGQLTYREKGLVKILDLGEWWYEKTKLPLPLGVNVVNKRLPLATQRLVSKLLLRSLEYAMEHRSEAVDYAMNYGRGLKKDLTDRFVAMYVNHYAQDLGARGIDAIERLFKEGKQAGLIPKGAKVDIISEIAGIQ